MLFIDLPQAHQMALTPETATEAPPPVDEPRAESLATASPNTLRLDPFAWLAEAAGQEDGERWWEQMVEERRRVDGYRGHGRLGGLLPQSNRRLCCPLHDWSRRPAYPSWPLTRRFGCHRRPFGVSNLWQHWPCDCGRHFHHGTTTSQHRDRT